MNSEKVIGRAGGMVQSTRPDRFLQQYCAAGSDLARRIELGTERESLLEVLDEDPYFGRQPAASRSNRKDRYNSFERSQQTDDSTFSEFCCEEPCRCLGNP
jgi:hypothetical protein